MSTITKLDKNVRLDRMLRRNRLRELSKDIKGMQSKLRDTIKESANLAVKGSSVAGCVRLIAEGTTREALQTAIQIYKQNIQRMVQQIVVSNLVLLHLTAVCRDPRRSGAAKDAIMTKLES